MLGDGAGERVFNGDDRGCGSSPAYPVENFRRARAWDHGAAGQHLLRCFVAEGTALALNRNFHLRTFLPTNSKAHAAGMDPLAALTLAKIVWCLTGPSAPLGMA